LFGGEYKKYIPIVMNDITFIISQKVPPFFHNEFVYGTVVSPYTGKVWLDRNLGASRVCIRPDDTSCYGDYYQWGRNYDGHQYYKSMITNTLATSISSAGSRFIAVADTMEFDWLETSTDLRSINWSKTDGSTVCPVGFRVPTVDELVSETIDRGVVDSKTAFHNFLKLPLSGYREGITGDFYSRGSWGHMWTSSIYAFGASAFYYGSNNAFTDLEFRSFGLSVRCIED
jgi:hypothetical protein